MSTVLSIIDRYSDKSHYTLDIIDGKLNFSITNKPDEIFDDSSEAVATQEVVDSLDKTTDEEKENKIKAIRQIEEQEATILMNPDKFFEEDISQDEEDFDEEG